MYDLINICDLELSKYKPISYGYVGINFEDELKIIFPRGFRLSDNIRDIRDDVKLLIKVFNKYKSRINTTLFDQDESYLNSKVNDAVPIEAMMWILEDFIKNNIYKEYESKYKTSTYGKNVTWPKTIKHKQCYFDDKCNIVYLDFIVKESNIHIDNFIEQAHKYIIKKSIDLIGWLYDGLIFNYNDCKLPFNNIHHCIIFLKKELSRCTLDRKKHLIKNMISVLDYLGHSNNYNCTKIIHNYKTEYFYNIWEDMIEYVFGNRNREDYYQRANWNINGIKSKSSSLEPDSILEMNNSIYVLDAKYHKYGVTNKLSGLPQSSDITKQLMYSSYIKNKYNKITYDAFILPYNSYKNIFNKGDNFMKCIGFADIDIPSFNNKKIVCILMDTKKLMQLYTSNSNHDLWKIYLVNLIDNENTKYLYIPINLPLNYTFNK